MTDTKKESLSALIDGEASEIEVHRLVREFRDDDSLTRSWALYQHIRTVARSSSSQDKGYLTPDSHETLHQRISTAISGEETHDQVSTPASSRKGLIAGSMALAASVVVAIFIGIQKPAENTNTTVATESDPIQAQPVSTLAADTSQETPELIELDEEKQRALRAYLNQHDRMARMNSNARLVNYKNDQGN